MRGLPELAVIGWPLERTYSPVMQHAALQGAGLSWTYGALPVPDPALRGFLGRASLRMRGLNVTTPHKGAVAALCTNVDALSRAAGAVNTVVFEPEGAIHGYNTDGPGLLAALRNLAGFESAGSRVALIGAGGSARAAAAAIAQAGATQITIYNRTPARAVAVCDGLRPASPNTAWSAEGLTTSTCSPTRLAGADLILSCVPPTAGPEVSGLIKTASPGAVFMDLNYGPAPTALHSIAVAVGLVAVPGLEMLLWQGVLAFERFTGIAAPATLEHMRRALVGAAGEWWLC